jgi:peptidyl-tRNA hydrolase
MSPGKAAAQAGHAFLEAYLAATAADRARAVAYRADGLGTKVVLLAPDLAALRRAEALAQGLGIPCARITDSGHILAGTLFDGLPIVTALGLGPASREEVRPIIDRFSLY